jgi:hypothetical protein
MPRPITARTTLDNLRKEAKRWLRALRANDAAARARFANAHPHPPADPTLRDVQHALASEYGLPGWTALKIRLTTDAPLDRYARVADALVSAYHTGDDRAMRVVWGYFGHMRTWDGMKRYVRLDLGGPELPADPASDTIDLADARHLVARAQGFEGWEALAAFVGALPADDSAVATKAVSLYASRDGEHEDIALRSHDWHEVLTTLRDCRLPGLHASGQMTDAILERLTRIEHLEILDLEGSASLTDEGVPYLARLRQLRHLNLNGCAISDRALEVVKQLRGLESLQVARTRITDAGAAHLAGCERLERVDLSGTASGDGAIAALAGKAALRDFRSGDGVTNRGLARLQHLPSLKTWQGGEERMALLSPHARPNYLRLRGTFTDEGMTQLVGLDGLFALDIDSDRLAVTGAGLAPLAQLPKLAWLAFDAKDDAMPHIARLPHLRFLLCQDTPAGDEAFVALSRSQSIEHIWGRRCYNLRRRGFTALANMPALRHLSVSCKNVDDEGLSALPRFPALRELMPMDVADNGYRHIARCARLESLVLMYCRETGDLATEHLARLPALRKYFASYNRITDRTPQLLSGMESLEEVTFDSCAGLTSDGVAALARLPRLRTLRVESMPGVTRDVVGRFPPGVRVLYAP